MPDRQDRVNARTEGEAFSPQPRKGEGDFRHCYLGQEAYLIAYLQAKKISLEQFNRIWDRIDPERSPGFRPR